MIHVFFFGAVWVGYIHILLEVPLSYFLFVKLQEILLLNLTEETLLSRHVNQSVKPVYLEGMILPIVFQNDLRTS